MDYTLFIQAKDFHKRVFKFQKSPKTQRFAKLSAFKDRQ